MNAEEEQRRILDAFHSRQATMYCEMLRNLPEENRPKSGPDLIADYIEWLAVTGVDE